MLTTANSCEEPHGLKPILRILPAGAEDGDSKRSGCALYAIVVLDFAVRQLDNHFMFNFEAHKSKIAELCARLKVSRLDVFGSATGESFGADSDIDVLVRFERDGAGLFERYFDLKEGLEEMLGRPVDVVVEGAVKNPYFKASMERSRRNLYAR
jgi:hypothetical protein